MNKECVTKRLRPGIRLSLSAPIIAGLGVLGVGALDAGTAGANTSVVAAWSSFLLPAPSAVSLSTSYGYSYLTAYGLIVRPQRLGLLDVGSTR